MHVLVQYGVRRSQARTHRNVIHIVAWLEISEDACGLTFIDGLVRLEGVLVLEDKDGCWRSGDLIDLRKDERYCRSEFLQCPARAPDVRFARVSDEGEILGVDADPFIGCVCGCG